MSTIEVIPHDDGDHVSADVYKDGRALGTVLYYAREGSFSGSIDWSRLEVAEAEAVKESVRRYSGMVGLLAKFQPDGCPLKKGGED